MNEKTYYYWDNGRLVAERTGYNYTRYFYDASGIIGMNRNGTVLFFEKNIFGDIINAYNSDGVIMASFSYDGFGNLLYSSGTMAPYVKFRYRGYYYDDETGFYYLKSRYYDPSICRFISADQPELIPQLATSRGELNLYSYCANNPIMNTDEDGHGVIAALLVNICISLLVGLGSYAAYELVSYGITGEWTWSWGVFAGVFLGSIIGGAIGALSNIIVEAIATGMATSFLGMEFQNAFGEANHSTISIISTSIVMGLLSGFTTWIVAMIPIQGINAGRGSLQQVSKQIITKLKKDQIARMSLSTFGKMLTYSAIYNSLNVVASGMMDAYDIYINRQKRYKNKPIYILPTKILG